MVARVDRALALVKDGAIEDLGGGQYKVSGYRVNGRCECADYAWRGVVWCKHRLAVALVTKAGQLAKGAGSAANTPTPSQAPEAETSTQEDDTTDLDLTQARAIRPVWGTGHQTDLDLVDGTRRRVNVPHSQAETQARALGWNEGTRGSGYWMAPAS